MSPIIDINPATDPDSAANPAVDCNKTAVVFVASSNSSRVFNDEDAVLNGFWYTTFGPANRLVPSKF